MTKDYYSPNEISFTRDQVLWLIKHLDILRDFTWPPEHRETGYIGGSTRIVRRAPFDTPACILGELEERIEKCGLDGIMMEFVYSASSEDKQALEQHIASALKLNIRTVDRKLKKALRYITGNCRRWVSCGKCSEFKTCKRKKREAVSYRDFRTTKKPYNKQGSQT